LQSDGIYLHGCFKSTMSLALDVGSLTDKKTSPLDSAPSVTRLSQPELITQKVGFARVG
jgi:hypothetical protein